ncbi:hypothetical protein KP77_25250 [Jeotgalibacillus alimentarius]|uniref:Uncharacterized protein n=1 Tax=Jeotgalibacillus alimentarius TaxID=135826 RepID=A0A0C2VR86_9BACL|nr:hypothetical protein [Jeotgalibacillus alimentarius]KIL46956.1 hypothetical protein KP77_25250 [Jeotgalibacillus alimentarius]
MPLKVYDIDEVHSIALQINENWDELSALEKQFVDEEDVHKFIFAVARIGRLSGF